MTITKDKLYDIVKTLMFEPTEQVIDEIIENWHELEAKIKFFDNLDLSNVKPMSHIDETFYTDFLREDEYLTEDRIERKQILLNAPSADLEFVTITKVVK
ncbi:aspartyl-tRNA(Asn)/glutamyl-tRNA(Gln) amidotransferase subunit C [Mycoplasmopsis mustelae]|uniref:Aspartyl-tRNA(Asn)/glutamyl-tRNA(Gln) amidotransferase subunit C n=1 Tax=Mycoplasmopsis mustelae TaxID=171289 RepID=A0A4R7UCP1_9BACT|nr:Asp-tRNA(Asn)/Glu-tRNA(Gln) amidotransferase subunit GatC [Mycoplasmopsis mustelae]TDV24198.1 aspartyl-tRNA(Asn)/glutamyl-tRNA(Gln) amidotransferase subunit C [Mycoplasmopsis mustelae]